MYASRHSPPPLLDEIINYHPLEAGKPESSWDGIIHRVLNHPDDGHASKLIRAIAHGEQVCRPFEDSEKFRIKGKMWLQLGNMGKIIGWIVTQIGANCKYSYRFGSRERERELELGALGWVRSGMGEVRWIRAHSKKNFADSSRVEDRPRAQL